MAYNKSAVAKVFDAFKVNVEVLGNKKGFDWSKQNPDFAPTSKEYKAASETFEDRAAEAKKLIPAITEGKILASYIESYVKDCGYSLQAGQRAKMLEGISTGKQSASNAGTVTISKEEYTQLSKASDELQSIKAVGGVTVTEEEAVILEVLRKEHPDVFEQCARGALDYARKQLEEKLWQDFARQKEEAFKQLSQRFGVSPSELPADNPAELTFTPAEETNEQAAERITKAGAQWYADQPEHELNSTAVKFLATGKAPANKQEQFHAKGNELENAQNASGEAQA
ncbi:TPA: hypothetical protein OUD88_002877 [Enterobacter hormaechei]|nr:hypothetical protein [Enterobacter hormaechei]